MILWIKKNINMKSKIFQQGQFATHSKYCSKIENTVLK